MLEQPDAPVHTSKLLSSRAEALAYPTVDIRLEVCSSCGLITNTAFDAAGHDYSASYEEVQAFSPRFRSYVEDLARTLVERHGLAGRELFEIGCGRGDFLGHLCEVTGGTARAVDPSFREDRVAGPAGDRITVERAFFEPSHVPDGVAAVVCRHTLEHVHDVASFLGALRQGLQNAPAAVVVFEVPDTLRVLRETAFWDVFYEHCSYFTPGSLARAFRCAALRPERLELTFDDQYVVLTSRVGAAPSLEPLPLEEPAAEVVELAQQFRRDVERTREHWRGLLRDARGRGEACVIWGAGSKGVGFLSTLGLGDEVACAVDVNPAKHGMFMPATGHEIVAPEVLRDVRPGIVVVMNPAYRDEIAGDLGRLGVDAAVIAL